MRIHVKQKIHNTTDKMNNIEIGKWVNIKISNLELERWKIRNKISPTLWLTVNTC